MRTRTLSVALSASLLLSFTLAAQQTHKSKLPKPKQLDSDIPFTRDASTGELSTTTAPATPTNGSPHAITVSTEIVPVTVSVTDALHAAIRGLTRADFQIFDDGAPQTISYFDASSEPASVALIMDASPSVLRDTEEMRTAARALVDSLSLSDQIAVVDFSEHTYLQLPFSGDWGLIRAAVARVDARKLLSDTGGSSIYQSLFLVARELFPDSGKRNGRKAIVLLTDGEDTGLGLTLDPASSKPPPGRPSQRLTFEDVMRQLERDNIQVFAVSTESRPKIMTAAWLADHAQSTLVTDAARREEIPAYTLYLAEMARRTGGQLYFIREAGTLADTFQQIALKIRAEYTLGFTPAASGPSAWHDLRVTVSAPNDPTIVYRPSYFGPKPQQ